MTAEIHKMPEPKARLKKYVRAILALMDAGGPLGIADHQEIAASLSPKGCNELADILMLQQVFLGRFEEALRAAGQAGADLGELVK